MLFQIILWLNQRVICLWKIFESGACPIPMVCSDIPQASPHFLRDIKESISRMAIPEGIVEPA